MGVDCFAKKLHDLGFDVIGYDSATAMVKAAIANVPKAVTISSEAAAFEQLGPYDVITSIMALPFVEPVRPTIEKLTT